MAILSFAKTQREYKNGIKTVTRRRWKERHYRRWQKYWDEGRLVHDAWSNLPFVAGAQKMGQFRLTCRPYHEYLGDMPESDLEAEGGMCETKEEFYDLMGVHPNEQVVVIRFQPM